MWDLSSLSSYQTWAPHTGSVASWPLDYQGSSSSVPFYVRGWSIHEFWLSVEILELVPHRLQETTVWPFTLFSWSENFLPWRLQSYKSLTTREMGRYHWSGLASPHPCKNLNPHTSLSGSLPTPFPFLRVQLLHPSPQVSFCLMLTVQALALRGRHTLLHPISAAGWPESHPVSGIGQESWWGSLLRPLWASLDFFS